MYPLAMSIKKILVMLIILYGVDQASSLKCYSCMASTKSPNPDSDCFIDPKKKDFEETCETLQDLTTLLFPGSASSSALINSSAVRGKETPYAVNGFDCLKVLSSNKEEKVITRGCLSKSVTDQDLKDTAAKTKYSIDSLDRCYTDFCNSSVTLSVGLLSLMSSLTLLVFTKLYIQ